MQFELSNSLVKVMKWSAWCRDTGIGLGTGREWRKAGWITPSVVISGHHYLTEGDVDSFVKRAKAGEFKGKNDPSVHLFKAEKL